MPSSTFIPIARSPAFLDPSRTTYELTFSGAIDMVETKQFLGLQLNEAIAQAAAKITEYNTNPNVKHSYVSLSRLADDISSVGRNIIAWTKPYIGASNE